MGQEDIFEVSVNEWKPGGFFYGVRHLDFIEERGQRLLEALSGYEPRTDHEFIRFVKEFWRIPAFMIAWEERCVSQGANERRYIEVRSMFSDLIGGIINGYEFRPSEDGSHS